MSFTFWISNRLRLTGSSGEKRSSGAVIAVIGVALAVMVMEITLAVVAGFKSEISRKLMGFDSQISIDRPFDYNTGEQATQIAMTPELSEILSILPKEGTNVSLSAQLPAMIKTDEDFAGLVFIGHDGNHDFSFEFDNIVEGNFPDIKADGGQEIALSRQIADQLRVKVGDKVYAYFFADGRLKTRRVIVSGVYDSNLGEYDKMVAYAPMSLLQSVLGTDSLSGTRIEISGVRIEDIEPYAIEIQQRIGEAMQSGHIEHYYPVSTVLQSGAIYFNWLALLDTNVIVIFALMLCVALFTLVSSLYLIVLDRVPTIGMLKSIGASRRWLVRLFVLLGLRLAVIGLVIGNVIGIGICLLQKSYGFFKLDPEMYYLAEVPVKVDLVPFLILNLGVLIVSYLILYIPARSAAKIDPTESIRFE